MDKIEKKLSKKYGKPIRLNGWTVKYSTRQRLGHRPDAYYFPPGSDPNRRSSNIRSVPDIEKYLGFSDEKKFRGFVGTQISHSIGKSYIYILTNPTFPQIKIGETTDIEKRLKSLQTSTPFNFEVYKLFESPFPLVKNYSSVLTKTLERIFHARYNHVNTNREFFTISPEVVVKEFEPIVARISKFYKETPEHIEEYLDLWLRLQRTASAIEKET
jgi:hypothetical protein